jgi:hypothetical protein
VLYRIVREHFETFRAQAATLRDGEGLPRFVEEEFRMFLRCGWLAGGFARFRCTACGRDRLVGFSCKGRGFCPGCGGRRMAERAAHLTDRVWPDVPVRQWVLSLPPRLRYQLAWNHDACKAVAGLFVRAVLDSLRRRASLSALRDGRSGAVAIIQRFGGALNLNVHIHALVLDGVFTREAEAVRFHDLATPTALDVAEVLAAVEPGIRRVLDRHGLGDDDGEGAAGAWADEAPVLADLAAASVQGVVALGARRGGRVSRLGAEPSDVDEPPPRPAHARWNGLDLHAGVVVPAGQRTRLEQVCRYVLRPPIAANRLAVTADGEVRLELRHRWADGTTHVVFEPLEFLGRLAVLVPRPRINLILYYGVLGARAAWRRLVVPGKSQAEDAPAQPEVPPGSDTATDAPLMRARGYLWAELMKRTFGFDVLECPGCGPSTGSGPPRATSRGGGRLRLVALIDEGLVSRRILEHLGLPAGVPEPRPARAPPLVRAAGSAGFDCAGEFVYGFDS